MKMPHRKVDRYFGKFFQTDVMQLFHEIIIDTAGYSYISYQFAVSHRTFALQNALRIIRQHSPSNED